MAREVLVKRIVEGRLKQLRKQASGDGWMAIIEGLGKSDDPLDEILLLHLLNDRSEIVREQAVEALERRRGPLARVGLRAAMGDPHQLVRNAAAEAMGWIGNRRDVPCLVFALKDPEWVVRCSAAEGLGYLGGPRARRALLYALAEDPVPAVRMWAAGALGELADETVAPLMEQALETEAHSWVHSALMRALYRLGRRPLEAYLACLEGEDFMIRHQTLGWMPEEVRPDDLPAVIAAVQLLLGREEYRGVRGDAEAALKRLQKLRAADDQESKQAGSGGP